MPSVVVGIALHPIHIYQSYSHCIRQLESTYVDEKHALNVQSHFSRIGVSHSFPYDVFDLNSLTLNARILTNGHLLHN